MREVEISLADLDAADAEPSILSADEVARANKFRFERERRRFAACRAALRRMLGGRLGVDPAAIEFSYGEFGKPHVRGIFFNLSHSGSLAVFAVSRTREVGVDIERIQPEVARELAPEGGCREFFESWTRREAVAKARGTGLAKPAEAEGWEIETFTPAEGYIASVAATAIFR